MQSYLFYIGNGTTLVHLSTDFMTREEKIDRIKKTINRINSFCEDMGFDQYGEAGQYGIDDFRNYVYDDYWLVETNNGGGHLEVNFAWCFIPEFDGENDLTFTDPDNCVLEIHLHKDKFYNHFDQVYEGLGHRKESSESRETWNFYPTKGDEEALNEVLAKVVKTIKNYKKANSEQD